jgi:lysophospholipase L1-like esterase
MRRSVLLSVMLAGSLALAGSSATPASPALPPMTPEGVQIVGIGDSVLAPRGCECPGALADYARLFGARHRTRTFLVNAADDGPATSTSLLTEVRRWPTLRADLRLAQIVVIMVGANDFSPAFSALTSATTAADAFDLVAARVRRNLISMVAEIRALHGPLSNVFICGYWNDFKDGDVADKEYTPAQRASAAVATEATNSALRAAALSAGAAFVPIKEAFDLRGDTTPMLGRDGNHLSPIGNELVARAILHAQAAAPTATSAPAP